MSMYIVDGKRLYLAALSRRMRELGYKAHVSHVTRVFSGERQPGPKFVEGMAVALEIPEAKAKAIIQASAEANRKQEEIPEWLPPEA